MALSNDDWREIQKVIDRRVTHVGEPFVQGKVVKNDQVRKLVWLKEFGDTPIPLIGFNYQVKYRYKEPTGETTITKTKAHSPEVEILVPKVGEIVLVAQHFGSRRLPKCLGVVRGKRFVQEG